MDTQAFVVCAVTSSKTIQRVIQVLGEEQFFDVFFIEPENIENTMVTCDVFIIDYEIFIDNKFDMKTQMRKICPTALTLCLTETENNSINLGENIDWVVSYDEISRGIVDAMKVLQVIQRKARRGILFNELLSLTREVKHDACNALTVMQGAAGRLAKIPGVAESTYYKQLMEKLTLQNTYLNKLVEIHEKYRASGLYNIKAS